MQNLINYGKLDFYPKTPFKEFKEGIKSFNEGTDLLKFEIKNVRKTYCDANTSYTYGDVCLTSKYFDCNEYLFGIGYCSEDIFNISIYIKNNINDIIDDLLQEFSTGYLEDEYEVECEDYNEFKEVLNIIFESNDFNNFIKEKMNIAKQYKICTLLDNTKKLNNQKILYKEGAKEDNYSIIYMNSMDNSKNGNPARIFAAVQYSEHGDNLKELNKKIKEDPSIGEFYLCQEYTLGIDKSDNNNDNSIIEYYESVYPVNKTIKTVEVTEWQEYK